MSFCVILKRIFRGAEKVLVAQQERGNLKVKFAHRWTNEEPFIHNFII